MNARNLKVLKVPVANKRLQVCKAVPFVKTRITIMADDDVTWPSTIFPWLLAPFEDEKIGAVGTSQRVLCTSNGATSKYQQRTILTEALHRFLAGIRDGDMERASSQG
ncbi:MAG: Type 2 glycosyltransferase [Icmadophila ericetorum]|nr:Type 2 glycosyltransferase [Icmadophila ericetorum]